MKLFKYILSITLAAFTLFACEKQEEIVPQFSNDKALYTVSQEGGSVTVSILATEDWTATVRPTSTLDEVDDVTVTPTSGKASNKPTTVTVTLGANSGYDRSATISFTGASLSSAVKVKQPGAEGERLLECTVAEFLEKPVDASVYYLLTGEVKSITNTTYSNFIMKDLNGDAEVLIYGLAYKSDVSNQKVSLLQTEGVQEGDIITIGTTRGQYGATIEGMHSYYISHEKSQKPMINLGQTSYEAGAEGETFELSVLANKANWTLSADVDWLTFDVTSGSASAIVNVTVLPGEGGEGTITLSADGFESVTCVVTRASATEISLADFLALEDGDKNYQISGIVTEIANTKFGNIYITDGKDTVYVYGILPEKGGESGQNVVETMGLKVGDYVTLQGPKSSYKGAAQGKNMWCVMHAPLKTAAEFVALEDDKTVPYILTGVVSDVVNTTYGNFDIVDESGSVYVYGLYEDYSAESRVKVFESLGIKEGDIITILGPKGSYNGSPQVNGSTYIMHTSGEGVEEEETIEPKSLADFLALEDGSTNYQISGVVTEIANTKYGNIYITDGKDTVYVYGILPEKGGESGQNVVETMGLKVGDYVTLQGPKSSYNGAAQGKNMWCTVHAPAISVADFLALEDDKAVPYLLKGEVKNVKNTEFGNFDIVDETGSVYVYGLYEDYSAGSRVKVFESLGIKEGDTITIVGPKGSYNGSPQVNGSSYVMHTSAE